MLIMKCKFQRAKDSDPEYGLLINEGELILDASGKPVPAPLYNYWQLLYELCINVNLT